MTNYNQVLSQVYSLSRREQVQLLEELKSLVNQSLEIDDDEEISSEELEQSQTAWENYVSGNDKGISSQDLKHQLLGDNFA